MENNDIKMYLLRIIQTSTNIIQNEMLGYNVKATKEQAQKVKKVADELFHIEDELYEPSDLPF